VTVADTKCRSFRCGEQASWAYNGAVFEGKRGNSGLVASFIREDGYMGVFDWIGHDVKLSPESKQAPARSSTALSNVNGTHRGVGGVVSERIPKEELR